MANLNVAYPAMKSQATRIDTGRQDIQNLLESLQNQVEDLIEDGFVTDEVSEAFNESFEKFTAGAQTTIQGLARMYDYLSQTVRAFYELDKQLLASKK